MRVIAQFRASSMRRRIGWWTGVALMITTVCGLAPATAGTDFLGDQSAFAWLFPLNPPSPAANEVDDAKGPIHLGNSAQSFTAAQLDDLFYAPDWHPESHTPMPEVVVHGRNPDTYACGYCHLPAGQGRPENAALAGLPAAYIIQQVAEMKSGARRSAWHSESYRPAVLMQAVADHVTDADLAAAAAYFAAQTLPPRVKVVERALIPRMQMKAWIYVIDARGGTEVLGQRVIEWAPDFSAHEKRDADMRYTAFVPPGSVRRGREIAMTGKEGTIVPCISCHGAHLEGMATLPPLAGRSPTYLLRQLVAYRTGDRAGADAAPMQAVVAKLGIDDMIAVAAYAASQ
jgi:cytochrome c553